MPRAIAMGTRVEQSAEFVPCAGGAGRRHLEGVANSLHRLPPPVEDLQVIILRSNRTLLLQREFRITLHVSRTGLSDLSCGDQASRANGRIGFILHTFD